MEDVVREATSNGTEDSVLAFLVEVVRTSILDGRPIFSNILDEPVFFRKYFREWVSNQMNADQAAQQAIQDAIHPQK
jgi:hypothetical protein